MARSIFLTCTILMAMLFLFASSDLALAGEKKVNINVWRGPSEGHKGHKFAPWGYHAKVPADDHKKHHY